MNAVEGLKIVDGHRYSAKQRSVGRLTQLVSDYRGYDG